MTRHRFLTALLLLGLVMTPIRAGALAHDPTPAGVIPARQEQVDVRLAGQIGGTTSFVVVQDHYAYINLGPRMAILDIADPARPVVAGRTGVLPGRISSGAMRGATVTDRYAYVANGDGGLRIFDVSNPIAPVEVGSLISNHDNLVSVAVSGHYAYVVSQSWSLHGLQVVDVSDPAAPVVVGLCDMPGAHDVTVVGDYAYATDWDGLRIIDIRNPAAPTVVGFAATPQWAWRVAVAGSYAYVAADTGGLRIIDIRNPAAPVEVGVFDLPLNTLGVTIVGDAALRHHATWAAHHRYQEPGRARQAWRLVRRSWRRHRGGRELRLCRRGPAAACTSLTSANRPQPMKWAAMTRWPGSPCASQKPGQAPTLPPGAMACGSSMSAILLRSSRSAPISSQGISRA